MADIFSSSIAKSLKETLELIVDDDTDGVQSKAQYKDYLEVMDMSDAYEDDLEMGGPGLAQETDEGAEYVLGEINEGVVTRYIARKFGLRLRATEEALEDGKYDKVIRAGKRLKRSLWKTVDIDAANLLNRAWNTDYVGGDGQPLCSASHTLPGGGTFSNTMATPISPSRIAVIVAATQVGLFPGHDGITEGYDIMRVLYPQAQWGVWPGILNSEKVPESNSNEINVVKTELDIEPVCVRQWSASETNYIFQVDVPEGGLNWRWRRKPRNKTWLTEDRGVMNYLIDARWSRGWTETRCVLGVQA